LFAPRLVAFANAFAALQREIFTSRPSQSGRRGAGLEWAIRLGRGRRDDSHHQRV